MQVTKPVQQILDSRSVSLLMQPLQCLLFVLALLLNVVIIVRYVNSSKSKLIYSVAFITKITSRCHWLGMYNIISPPAMLPCTYRFSSEYRYTMYASGATSH